MSTLRSAYLTTQADYQDRVWNYNMCSIAVIIKEAPIATEGSDE